MSGQPHSGSFQASDLIKLKRPPWLARVEPGHKVMLASEAYKADPLCMIVADTLPGDDVLCRWGDKGEHSATFPLATLTCFGAKL